SAQVGQLVKCQIDLVVASAVLVCERTKTVTVANLQRYPHDELRRIKVTIIAMRSTRIGSPAVTAKKVGYKRTVTVDWTIDRGTVYILQLNAGKDIERKVRANGRTVKIATSAAYLDSDMPHVAVSRYIERS